MKLVTILICIQAVFMLASIAGTGFIMYRVNGDTTSKNGVEVFKANSLIFYIVMALHGTSLLMHGLSTFWCKGK